MTLDLDCIIPTEAHKLLRLYNSLGVSGEERDPYWFSMGPDKRLSSQRYDIKMGYWAPRIESCFLEVFLRRKPGEFTHQNKVNIDADTQQRYKIAKFTLNSPLILVPKTVQDMVCSSAYYSNELEKDNFVQYCLNHPNNFDGIEYRSNHDSNFICYALFERTIERLKIESNYPHNHFDIQPVANSPRDLIDILRAFPGAAFE